MVRKLLGGLAFAALASIVGVATGHGPVRLDPIIVQAAALLSTGGVVTTGIVQRHRTARHAMEAKAVQTAGELMAAVPKDPGVTTREHLAQCTEALRSSAEALLAAANTPKGTPL